MESWAHHDVGLVQVLQQPVQLGRFVMAARVHLDHNPVVLAHRIHEGGTHRPAYADIERQGHHAGSSRRHAQTSASLCSGINQAMKLSAKT